MRYVLAGLNRVSVCGGVGRTDNAAHAGVIIIERRIGSQRFGYPEDLVQSAAELVNDDDRALFVAEAPKLRFRHVSHIRKRKGDVTAPLQGETSKIRICT